VRGRIGWRNASGGTLAAVVALASRRAASRSNTLYVLIGFRLASAAVARRESDMKLEGGCYCGKVRYVAEGQPMLKAQCHCRECQYVSGGSPNVFMLMPPAGFSYVRGVPKQFLPQ